LFDITLLGTLSVRPFYLWVEASTESNHGAVSLAEEEQKSEEEAQQEP
jgi:hypothetical protein